MATDFTQDAVLHFLQSSGGSVKNAELLLHFRGFIRDHADRDRNRELFKKFVNSVATVRQTGGVSYVVLRKKFKGHVPGEGGSSSGSPRLPAVRNTEGSPRNADLTRPESAERRRQKAQQREEAGPAPPGEPARETILPAAGIVLKDNNVGQQQVNSSPAAQGVSQTLKTGLKTSTLPEPAAPDQSTKVGQQRIHPGPLHGSTPVLPAASHPQPSDIINLRNAANITSPEPAPGSFLLKKEDTITVQQIPETLRVNFQESHQHHHPQLTPRRVRHRQSYKSAVSYDDDDDEEEEVPINQQCSAGGVQPLMAPLNDSGRAISASPPPPPSPSVSSASSSSERTLPKIYIQDMEEDTLIPQGPSLSLEAGAEPRGQWAGVGREPIYVPGESTRRSLPSEAEHHMPSPHHLPEGVPHHRYSQPPGVQLESNQTHRTRLSSSHSSVFSPSPNAAFTSSDWPPSGSPRASGRTSSSEDLQARAGEHSGSTEIQEALEQAQGTRLGTVPHHVASKTTLPLHQSTGNLYDTQEFTAHLSPLHRSTDHLHVDQDFGARVMPWHLSTGDLYSDHEDAESSDGSISSPQMRQRPGVAKRLSSRLRGRMCRSLGADLDQLIQDEPIAEGAGGEAGGAEGRGVLAGGNETARRNRLHRISSTLSLHYNLSSSSLSSCSTPPRSHSLADLIETVERKGGRRKSVPITSFSSNTDHECRGRQSLVPLEPREHAWLVKGAAGAWTDIYSLFREDPSLLNRQDFISGFTVLHWIAKHGDHRVLNTLWYGVEKAGMTFNINARSTSGHTPLHIAAIHGNKNTIRLLVNKFNANVRLRDTAGKKPWQYLSRTAPLDIFQLLGAPARVAVAGEGVGKVDSSWEHHQRRRRRHHLSSASSGERPSKLAGGTKVKRSSSIAAFLKHKSLQRFYGHHSDSPL